MRNHKKTIPAVAYPTIVVLIFIAAFVAAALPSALAQQSDEELAKQLANPIASLISVPFQSNFEFKLGPNNDGFRYTLNFQPVIPFSLNKDWNLIIRTIVPIIDQIDVIAPNTSENGLSGYDAKFLPFTEETRGRDDYRRRPGVSLPHGERLVAWNGEVWSRSNICGVETGRPMDNWLAFQSHLVSRGRRASSLRQLHFSAAIHFLHHQDENNFFSNHGKHL
jgi:hypothetical protein